MKKVMLNKIVRNYQDWKYLINNTRKFTYYENEILIPVNMFLDYFDAYEIKEKNIGEYPFEIFTYYLGVKFIAILNSKEAKIMGITEPTRYIEEREVFFNG